MRNERISRRTLCWGAVTAGLAVTGRGLASAGKGVPVSLAESAARAEMTVEFPAIDFAEVARCIVQSMHPQSGERAVLLFDPTYYPQLAVQAERTLRDLKVDPVVRLTFPPLDVAYPANRNAIKQSENNWDKMLGPLFEQADLFLWLPGRNLAPDLRWERLVNSSPARSIHCHFVLPPFSGRSAAELTFLCKLYEHAILNSDSAALSKTMSNIIQALRGNLVRITSAEGTNLEIRVPPDAWFHQSNGDIPKERAIRARAVRDREIEHPAGALRFIPDIASANGTVVTRVGTSGVLGDVVRLELRNGIVVEAHARKDDVAFQKLWNEYGGDINRIAEIVIGTNPLLLANLPSGELPYYGYGAGALRISFGDNWESGGSLRSGVGDPLWTFISKATVRAGDVTIIRDGVLQLF
jgi:hypothetical protein